MPSFFFDASALVKLYVREEGTPKVIEIAQDSAHNSIVILDLSLLELRSAVRRQQREGNVSFSRLMGQNITSVRHDAQNPFNDTCPFPTPTPTL